ncbi:MAG: hypothetical protein MRQ09_05935, partial [Candidatus Midichloria sp.]|nr:hypothetical protein [Candidatus Midichloria sp.]
LTVFLLPHFSTKISHPLIAAYNYQAMPSSATLKDCNYPIRVFKFVFYSRRFNPYAKFNYRRSKFSES